MYTNMKIVLNGTNTVSGVSNGFFSPPNSNITFSGKGSLAIIDCKYAPFVSHSNLTVDGATLTVSNTNDGAVQVGGALAIRNGAYVEATGLYYGVQAGSLYVTSGSKLTANSTGEYGNSIWVFSGSLSISNAVVTGKGYYPLMCDYDIMITDSTVAAESTHDYEFGREAICQSGGARM